MLRKYWSPVMLACYDDAAADAAAAEAAAAAKAEADAAAAATAASAGKSTFTQDQVNKFLAEDRRKNEARLKAEKKAELEKISADFKKLSEHANLTETERDEYKTRHEQAEAELASFRSEKETLLKQKKEIETTLTSKLTAEQQRAKEWETRYQESSIKRELSDAAVKTEAVSPQQMVRLLRSQTKLAAISVDGKETGEYQVVIDLEEIVDGKKVVSQLSPEEAMARMKKLPEYGNLFKAGVVSGVGSSNTASTAGTGPVDIKNMTQAEYNKLRKENPERLYGRGK